MITGGRGESEWGVPSGRLRRPDRVGTAGGLLVPSASATP